MLNTLERRSGRMPIVPELPILIVIEDDMMRRELIYRLSGEGYVVEPAENGEHAIDLFRQEPREYAAVLMDRQMSGLDGEEAMLVLRCIGCDAPVVFLDDDCNLFDLESAICDLVYSN